VIGSKKDIIAKQKHQNSKNAEESETAFVLFFRDPEASFHPILQGKVRRVIT